MIISVWVMLPLLAVAGAALLAIWAGRLDRDSWRLAVIASGAFIVRACAAVALFSISARHLPVLTHLQSGNGFWRFGLDSEVYHTVGASIVQSWHQGTELINPGVGFPYFAWVAFLYRIFGVHPLYPIIVNGWLCAANALLAYVIGYRLFAKRAPALLGAALVGFWPSSIFWSTQLMKDSLAGCLFFCALALIVVLADTSANPPKRSALRQTALFAALACATIALTLLRYYMGVLLSGVALASFVPAAGAAFLAKRPWRGLHYVGLVVTLMVGMLYGRSVNLLPLLSPGNPGSGHYRIGLQRWQQRDLSDAFKELSKAVQFDPTLKGAFQALGAIRSQQGSLEAKRGDYVQALLAYDSAIRHYLAYLRLEPHPHQQALAHQAIARLFLEMAVNYLGRSWGTEAQAAYDRACSLDPSVVNVHPGLQERITAVRTSIPMTQQAHAMAQVLFTEGIAFRDQGQFSSAALSFAKAIVLEPSYKEASWEFGSVKARQALALAASIIQSGQGDLNALQETLEIYYEAITGYLRYAAYENDVEKRQLVNRIMARLWLEIAIHYVGRAWPVEAQAAYDRAVALDTTAATVYPALEGEIAAVRKATGRQRRHIVRRFLLDHTPVAHLQLFADEVRATALAHLRRDELAEAAAAFDRLLMLDPTDAAAYWYIGKFQAQQAEHYMAQDKRAKALEMYAASIHSYTAYLQYEPEEPRRHKIRQVIAELRLEMAASPPAPSSDEREPLKQLMERLVQSGRETADSVRPDIFMARIREGRQGFVSSGGSSVMDAWAHLGSPWAILAYLPRALLVGFFAPFPRQWFDSAAGMGTMQILAGEMGLLYVLLWFVPVGAVVLIRRRSLEGWYVLSAIFCTAALMSLVIANLGTLFRLRLMFMLPALVIAAGGGYEALAALRTKRWRSSGCASSLPGTDDAFVHDGVSAPMRIVRVLTRLNIGGPAIHAALLCTKMDPARFSSCLVIGQPERSEGDLSHLVDGHAGVRVIRLHTLRRRINPWRDLVALVGLTRILWRERPHMIHTHMAKAGTLGRLAGMGYNTFGPGRRPGARARLVHTFHGHVLEGYFHPWLSGLFTWIERMLARRTDLLIAVSPLIRDDLVRKKVGTMERIRVIPLGLDLTGFARLAPANGSSTFRVGMVGRLVPIKNPSLFLAGVEHTMKRLSAEQIRGVVIGDGPLREQLEREVRQRGIDACIQFAGWQRDLIACYQQLDAVCLTSWNEGTPVAMIEAMAAGRPVVATDVGGVRDVLGESRGTRASLIAKGAYHVGVRGILIRPGDAQGLAAALAALATDGGLRRTLGEAGRAHVLQMFTAERLIQEISMAYERLHREG